MAHDAVEGTTDLISASSCARLEGRACLAVIDDDSSRALPLPGACELTIGRAPEAGVRLRGRGISRAHAKLIVSPEEIVIVDLGSTNGTLVNGRRLARPERLAAGDAIGVGSALLFVQRAAGPAPAPAELPAGVRAFALGEREVVVSEGVWRRTFAVVERLAATDLAVTIEGETGTGKELAAAALHAWSRRREGSFVAVNCAALPESLAESELFGHERGAFTGAATSKRGLIESAGGGTLFLDEVGELSPAVQAKLLRVLENKEVTRLGDVRPRPVNLRVVAATHRSLEEDVKRGRFRSDLYFRLGSARVTMPPLRERPEDLPALVAAFLREACARQERPVLALSAEVRELLRAHGWPGNVRELRNVVDYLAATVLEATVLPWHLPRALHEVAAPASASAPPAAPAAMRRVDEELRELERGRLVAALEATGGNQTHAARLIGMPLRTFVYKLKKHGLSSRRRNGIQHDAE